MALSNDKKIFAALGVLAVLGVAFAFQQKKLGEEAAQHAAPAGSGALTDIKLAPEDVENVTKIDIVNAGKGEVVLEKADDKWKLTKPLEFPANGSKTKQILDNLKDLKIKDSIDTGTSQYGQYDLDDAKAVHVTVWKGADKAQDLYFGKNGSRGQTVRIGGKDGVYVATGYSGYLYTAETKAFRDGKMLDFDDGKISGVTIAAGGDTIALTKDGEKWTGKSKGQAIADFDDAKVKDLLRSYKALTADDFADGKSDADTGLDKPDAVVSFTAQDGSTPPKVLVGKVASGTNRYARLDNGTVRYVVLAGAADWATGGAAKFQKTAPKPPAGGPAGSPKPKK